MIPLSGISCSKTPGNKHMYIHFHVLHSVGPYEVHGLWWLYFTKRIRNSVEKKINKWNKVTPLICLDIRLVLWWKNKMWNGSMMSQRQSFDDENSRSQKDWPKWRLVGWSVRRALKRNTQLHYLRLGEGLVWWILCKKKLFSVVNDKIYNVFYIH